MGPRHRGRRQIQSRLDRRLTPRRRRPRRAGGRGEPHAASRRTSDLAAHPGQPRPSPDQPDYTLPGTIPMTAMQGPATDQGTGQGLDKTPYVDERMSFRAVADRLELWWASVAVS